MKKITVFLLLLLPLTVAFPQDTPVSDTALVLIDIQQFYFDLDKMPLVGNEAASRKAAEILNYFRDHQMLVVHVRHKGGGEFHADVMPLADEKVIEKHEVNAFLDTDLLEYLRDHGIKNLVLAGMQTHMCLEAATRAASDYGFKCTVIGDACATRDLKYGGKVIKAEDVHLSTLATLEYYATVMTTDEFLNPSK